MTTRKQSITGQGLAAHLARVAKAHRAAHDAAAQAAAAPPRPTATVAPDNETTDTTGG